MRKTPTPLRLALLAIALMAVPGIFVFADTSHPDRIGFRWVLAGIEKTAPLQLVDLPPETRLRSGDKIKIYFKTRTRCFFYLFHQDPDGLVSLLYPPALPATALESETPVTIPAGERWFELDEQMGVERFHVLVSPTPLLPIEALYADYAVQPDRNGAAPARLLAAIEQLRRPQRILTSKAERPIAIGGTIRGAGGKGSDTSLDRLDRLAEDIQVTDTFCRTYTIEHH